MIKKIALVFPGQGSQYVGMAKDLYKDFAIVRQTFEEADEVLSFGLSSLCINGSLDELTKTENAQPAILTTSIAMFRLYMQEIGIKPEFGAGHSLGEITALTAAGAIRFSDALQIVRRRGRLMQEASEGLNSGSMAAVRKVAANVVERECSRISTPNLIGVVSNYNSPDQTVVSGHSEAVNRIAEELISYGAEVIPLQVSAAFHSPIMRSVAEKMKLELEKYQFMELDWPVISNVNALPYKGKESIVENLKLQITQPVRWVETISYLQKQKLDLIVEIGPKTVLRNLCKANAPALQVFAYDDHNDLGRLKTLLQEKKPVAPGEFKHTVVTKCIQIAICAKNRNWDNEVYQKGVVEPYRKILKLQDQLEAQGKEPTPEEMFQALEMLKSVLITKKVPYQEMIDRFEEVLEITGARELFGDYIKSVVAQVS